MRWSGQLVAEVLGVAGADPGTCFSAVETDTRTLSRRALFVALRGERFDGHDFLTQAKEHGAAAAVVRRGTPAIEGMPMYAVDDPLAAYGALARAFRASLGNDTPTVAVTGTNGKTSTKEMIVAVLRTSYRVHGTAANHNNLVGVPKTILATPSDTTALVVEAGSSCPGEIAALRTIIDPTIAVVTNVGPGHLEGLSTLEGVLEEKVALIPGAQLAVVGEHPLALGERARTYAPTTVCGLDASADLRPDRWWVGPDGRPRIEFAGSSVRLPVLGEHQVANAMLALAVAQACGVAASKALAALADVTVLVGRAQFRSLGGLAILDDTYNANPDSLRAALKTFERIREGRRSVVVVGTMLELGDQSAQWHTRMAREIAATRPDMVAAVGDFVPAFGALGADLGAELVTANGVEELGTALARRLRGNEALFLKASRGVKLERVLTHLTS